MNTETHSHLESIWEYPRTPIVEPTSAHIEIIHRNTLIADTHRALKVCENGHPPSYYIPPEDIRMELMEPSSRNTFCEWKGVASYFHLFVSRERIENVAWFYPQPYRGFEAIRDYLAFYPALLDQCLLDGEAARPEPRPFYGGWITNNLQGPFR